MNRTQWRTMTSKARRVLGPWVDAKTRRPLVTLVAVSLAVVLWPLALDVGKALVSKETWVAWSLGEGIFLAILAVGLGRLALKFPTDSWPTPARPDEPATETVEARCILWALRLAVATLVIPIK